MSGGADVRDGDSLVINGEKIRLLGVDAPELHQTCTKDGAEYACGREAQRYVQDIVRGKDVKCTSRDTDRYERQLSICMAGDIDINRALVSSGHAISLAHIGMYSKEERDAKQAKRGIWAGEFLEPWQWREAHMKR